MASPRAGPLKLVAVDVEIGTAAARLAREVGVTAEAHSEAAVGQVAGAVASDHDARVRLAGGTKSVGETLRADRAKVVLDADVVGRGDAEDGGVIAGVKVDDSGVDVRRQVAVIEEEGVVSRRRASVMLYER